MLRVLFCVSSGWRDVDLAVGNADTHVADTELCRGNSRRHYARRSRL
jgi:hypothetical protein